MNDDAEILRTLAEQDEAALQRLTEAMANLIRNPAAAGRDDALRAMTEATTGLRSNLGMLANRHLLLRAGTTVVPYNPLPNLSGARQPTPAYFDDVSHRLRLWGITAERIGQMLDNGRIPLYSDSPSPDDPASELIAMSDRVNRMLHGLLNPASQDSKLHEYGCFADIPLPVSQFLAHIHAACRIAMAQGRSPLLRFLDVGCGAGIKVMMAAQLFYPCHGLELDAGYVAVARDLVERMGATSQCHIIEGDALRFADYGSYDVIYFYCPMRDTDLMAQLEQRMVAAVRPGTILIAPYPGFFHRAEALGCAHVAGSVFLARQDPPEADRIRRVAERIGIHLPGPTMRDDRRAGHLRPVIQALRATGYWRSD